MKPGRPKSHIKGKWVTWKANEVINFYELDQKENLIYTDGLIKPHHTYKVNEQAPKNQEKEANSNANQVVLKPKVSEIDNYAKDSSSKTAKPAPAPKLAQEDGTEGLFDYTFDFSNVLNGDNEEFSFFDNINSDQEESWWNH